MRSSLVFAALLLAACHTSSQKPAPDAATPDATPDAVAPVVDDPSTRPQPHPDIPIGTTLTAYTGPRFLTGETFVPEARTVIADETGRVRALLKGPPPESRYPVVTLPGALAVAGLHDAHIHIQGVGQGRDQVKLLGSKSAAEAKKRVAEWAQKHPDAAAVLGRGWDQSLFPGAAWPTWKDLEGADAKGRPILLERVDGHAAWANKKMLDVAGITKDTRDPPGGKILRDDHGEPTGVLVDNAIDLASKKLPAPSSADLERWLKAGLDACAEAGLVAVHDMGMGVQQAQILMKLDDAGALPVRVFVYLDGTDPASYELLSTRKPSPHLKLMGVKLYADGAMGSRGAALLDDYSDDKGNKGLLLTEPAVLAERIALVHQKGFAAAVHAIGDRGNRVVLDAMKASPAPDGVRDRIEHAQLVSTAASGADDFQRFAEQHVVASMQPTHATSDMRWAEQRVGSVRVKGAYAWRTMLEHGVRLAFGSDAPVEDERPQLGIYAAITRQDADGKPPEGFLPEEKLTQTEALKAFAAGAAYAVGMEQHLGALTPGMFFDVTLFVDDAAAQADAGDTKAWLKTRPAGIVVGGVLREAAAPAKK
jgi:hypothetical protein